MKHKTNCSMFHVSGSMNKGISILLAILIMNIILAIGLGISLISLQQTKMMQEVGHSVIAFYSADAGIEEVLAASTDPVSNCPASTSIITLSNGATYEVSVTIKGETTPEGMICDADYCCITSNGTFKETNRAIKIQY